MNTVASRKFQISESTSLSFGTVRLGQHTETKQRVAIKILEKTKIAQMSDVGRVAREIKILESIKHPNIIELYEVIDTKTAIFMIMEYAAGGELFDYIVSKNRLQEKEAANFYYQLVTGIEFLHSQKIGPIVVPMTVVAFGMK